MTRARVLWLATAALLAGAAAVSAWPARAPGWAGAARDSASEASGAPSGEAHASARFDAPALFTGAPAPEPAPETVSQPRPDLMPPPALLGLASDRGNRLAWLRAGDGPAVAVREGDEIAGWRVEAIGEGEVQMAREEERVRLGVFGG